MKKQRQHLVLILVGIGVVLVIILSVLIFSGNKQKRITDFVMDNKTELESIALSYLHGDIATTKYKGVEVDGLYSGEHSIVQFYCSGFGLAPSTKYFGFYYSEDDIPVAFQNVDIDLTSTVVDEWIGNDGTDNGGLTKKITDGWFYFEAWF